MAFQFVVVVPVADFAPVVAEQAVALATAVGAAVAAALVVADRVVVPELVVAEQVVALAAAVVVFAGCRCCGSAPWRGFRVGNPRALRNLARRASREPARWGSGPDSDDPSASLQSPAHCSHA